MATWERATRLARGLVLEPPTPEHERGLRANERITATTGLVLVVFLGVQGVTLLDVRDMITVHIVVGILLIAPLAVKLASTGYRMVRYYAGARTYRRKGPPHPLMRGLAPLLVLSTVVLMASGVALVVVGPGRDRWLGEAHVVSFWVWLACAGIHLLVYIWRVPAMLRARAGQDARRVAARARALVGPLALNVVATGIAALASVALLPATHAWTSVGSFHH